METVENQNARPGGPYGEESIPAPGRTIAPRAVGARVVPGSGKRRTGWQGELGTQGEGRWGKEATGPVRTPVARPAGTAYPWWRWKAGGAWRRDGDDGLVVPPSAETAARFYRQARAMRERTDDYEYFGNFSHYYPVYEDMTAEEKRGYFSWRTAFRRGEARDAPVSFVFVHVYELLMQVGVGSPEAGLDAMERVLAAYPARAIRQHLPQWMRDYAVYYGLKGPRADRLFAEVTAGDQSQIALLRCDETPDEELYAALSTSAYEGRPSVWLEKNHERAAAVAAAAFRAATAHFRERTGGTLAWFCPGPPREVSCRLFANAVFHDWRHYLSYRYEVNPARIYRCRNGRWLLEGPGRLRSRLLGELLRECDRQLRAAFPPARTLKKTLDQPELVAFVRQAVADRVAAERQAARPVVRLDVGKLDAIRRDAALTREALLADAAPGEAAAAVPEEGGERAEAPVADIAPAIPSPPAVPAVSATSADSPQVAAASLASPAAAAPSSAASPTPFSALETDFLRLVLAGAPTAPLLRARHLFASAVMEAVNEKLLPLLGDVALEEGPDGQPALVEDYRPQVATMIAWKDTQENG